MVENSIEKRLRKVIKPVKITDTDRFKDILLQNILQAYRINREPVVTFYRIEQDGGNYSNWLVDMVEMKFKRTNTQPYSSSGMVEAGMNSATDIATEYHWKDETLGEFEAIVEKHLSQGYSKAIIKYIM